MSPSFGSVMNSTSQWTYNSYVDWCGHMLRYFECNKGDVSASKYNAVKTCIGITGETPTIIAVLARGKSWLHVLGPSYWAESQLYSSSLWILVLWDLVVRR